MITIDSQEEKLIFKFPQSEKEVTAENLVELTKNYTLGKGKILLCLVGTYNLFALRTAIRGSKDVNVIVTPLIAKISEDVQESFNFKVGDVAIVAPSDVERGIHVDVTCGASYTNLQKLVKTHKEFADAIINNDVIDEHGSSVTDICALSFKILNAYDIAATISTGSKEDAFIESI